jgi:molecular chaperone HscB
MSNHCKSCAAPLASALVCEACGVLQPVEAPVDPWAALGLPVGFALDARLLKQRMLALQRRMHPDFFGGATAEDRALAERNTAELNVAEGLLSDAASRADLLVQRLGGPDELAERQMPQAFLLEVLEWNETLDEARTAPPGSPAREALDELEERLTAERRLALERIARRLAPLPAPGAAALTDVRRELNAVRYLERTLSTLSKLRLEQARGTR